MTSILRHAAEAFSPARQGTILNSHRVIGIATSMVLNCALVNYIMMTSDVRLPDAVKRHSQDKTKSGMKRSMLTANALVYTQTYVLHMMAHDRTPDRNYPDNCRCWYHIEPFHRSGTRLNNLNCTFQVYKLKYRIV